MTKRTSGLIAAASQWRIGWWLKSRRERHTVPITSVTKLHPLNCRATTLPKGCLVTQWRSRWCVHLAQAFRLRDHLTSSPSDSKPYHFPISSYVITYRKRQIRTSVYNDVYIHTSYLCHPFVILIHISHRSRGATQHLRQEKGSSTIWQEPTCQPTLVECPTFVALGGLLHWWKLFQRRLGNNLTSHKVKGLKHMTYIHPYMHTSHTC